MGLGHNTTIARSGLVFYYDTSNTQKSWRGAPATNLLGVTSTNVYTFLDTGNATYGPVSLINTPTPYGTQAYQITFRTTGDNGYYGTNTTRFTSNSITINRDGTTVYKYSVWVYTEAWTDWDNNVYKYVTGSNGMSAMSDSGLRLKDSLGRIWRRYWMTGQTLGGGGTAGQYHTFYKNGTLTNDLIVLLCAPDFYAETVGGYVPAYVNGTRSVTQAMLDLTNNNTITADSLTYNADGTFSFNGTGNYISAGSNASLSFTNAPFTLESTFKITGYQNDTYYGLTNMLIERGPASTYNYALQVSNPTTISFIKRTGAESLQYYGFTVPTLTNNNTIVTLTYNGSNSASLYHNGTLIGSANVTNVGAGGSDVLYIGGYVEARTKFTGSIYSTKIYNQALTATEVLQNFAAQRDRYGI
jgi:hypothetical protein